MSTHVNEDGLPPAKIRVVSVTSSSCHGNSSRISSDATPYLQVTQGEHILTDISGTSDSVIQNSDVTSGFNSFQRSNLGSGGQRNRKFIPKMTPFSKTTPCIQTETPLILATARQTGSSILTSYNSDSIKQLRNTSDFQQSVESSAYFSKQKSSKCSTPSSRLTSSSTSSSATAVRGQGSSRSSSSVSTATGRSGGKERGRSDQDDMGSADVRCLRNTAPADDEDSINSQIYMGMMWHRGKLGVAYYDLDTTVAHIMLDIQESVDFPMALKVVRELNPVQIVLCSTQDEKLVNVLRNYVKETIGEETDGQLDEMLKFLPSIDFSYEICRRRVLSVDLPSIPDHFSELERSLNISSMVPFENLCTVRALGGLLKHLDKSRVGIELEEIGTKLPILNIKVFSLATHMALDPSAYSALQIFQREAHPSVYKAGTGQSSKEGLSLFGIMNRTKSSIGSKMLRSWFLQPLKNLSQIRARHEAVAFFCNPRNQELTRTLEEAVKHVKNITKILTRMHQSQASIGDWQALYKTVYNATSIKEVCRGQPQTLYIFKQVAEHFSEDLHKITNFINKIIDFPESSAQGRFVVKPNVDAKLDEKKRIFSELPEIMSRAAYEELNKLDDNITKCSVIYMPQIGYLLAIPEVTMTNVSNDGDGHSVDGLEFVFASNNMMHYRSAGTRGLDALFGDARCDITDKETAIMHKLQNLILEHTHVLLPVLDQVAELDCLLSLATCAREYSYVRPIMTEENVIEVVAGRHPIQEVCCGTFVPNNVTSNIEYGKIKVLTGPNACGKSIYLKQVALIVYLAQIGSFVPADSAKLGLIDSIYTRVRSLESVSVGLSTFMIDINQMSQALCNAGERSVCVIDEFGKGTDMEDGVALLCACLSHWVKMGNQCPHIMVSTHFHTIIHKHLLPRSPLIKYMTLETLHNGEELVFLYQLVEGNTGSSYAFHAAAQAGLPQEIVRRGKQVFALIREGKPIERVDTASTETQNKRCSAIVEKFKDLDLESADIQAFLSDFVVPTFYGNNVLA